MKTMKKLFLTIMSAMLLTSVSAQNGYTITGTAEGTVKGDTIFLCGMQGWFAMVPLDTAIVKKGKFEFTGQFDGCTHRYLLAMHKGEYVAMAAILLENAPISVQMFKDEKKNIIVGGPSARLWDEYERGAKEFDDRMAADWSVCLDTLVAEDNKIKERLLVNTYSADRKNYTKRFMLQHIGTPVADYLLAQTQSDFTKEEQEQLLKLFGQQKQQFYAYKGIMEQRAIDQRTGIGAQFTDFSMPDPKGKMISVSDYVKKNKYTLIDFWASWCGPCRAEMPTVVKAYDLYHAKGFEVVGVSLDNNKEAWIKAIDQLKMPWPHMSDIKGWGCAGAALYNVKGIPANVLIDQQGKIVAKNLRGQDLLDKMAELLK